MYGQKGYEPQRREIPQTECRNAAACIFKGPCIVLAIHCGDVSDNVDVDIFDGLGNNGELKFRMTGPAGIPDRWHSPGGTLFRKGIYIEPSVTTTYTSVTFIPWEYLGQKAG